MQTRSRTRLLSLAAILSAAILSGPAHAAEAHKVFTPGEIEWKPGPRSIPSGAEAATLYGDPSKEEVFALRLKLPENYTIPPHTHPRPEIVTVISGTLNIGMGEKIERDKMQQLPAGSFFAFEPGMAHYVSTEGETVLQLNSSGPWALEYVNPEDDPRS